MAWLSKRTLVMVGLVVVMVTIDLTAAFNDDAPIYKWSPLWFNRYYGRGHNLYKRVRGNISGYSVGFTI